MNILRRAWWGVYRRRIQSLTLLIILLAIGTLIIASLSIQVASEKAKQDTRKALGNEVIVQSYDDTGMGKIEYLPLSLVQSLIQNEYVENYNTFSNIHMVASNFNVVIGEISDKVEITVTGDVPENYKFPDIQINQVTDTSRLKEFNNGIYTLVEGRHITKDIVGGPYVLIEQTLANENNLFVSDKLIVNSLLGEPKEMEIIGIYQTKETIDDVRVTQNMPIVTTLYLPYNFMFTNENAIPLINSTTNDTVVQKLILSLDDPENISSFISQTNPLLDSSKYRIYTNEEQIKKMSSLIDQVADFSTVMLWLILICGAIILCLLFIYFVKGRLREMGVLLSLGESRYKLVFQLIIETLILVIVAFSVSMFSGQVVAKQASEALLEQQQADIEKERQLQMQGAFMLNVQNDGQETMISSLDIKLSSDIWLQLIYVTLFILLISMLYPIVIIFKLKPTAILALQE